MEENTELEELLKPQEESEETSESSSEDDNASQDDVKLAEANKKLFARAKKAETELKAYKEKGSKEPKAPAEGENQTKSKSDNDIDAIIEQKLGERELDSQDLSDEAKGKIRTFAKTENVSIKEALKSDFFKFIKEKEEKAKLVEEASIGKGQGTSGFKDISKAKPSDFDLATEEGRKGWEEFKKTWK